MKTFWNDRGGNFAAIAAVLTLPLAISAGLAVDVVSANNHRAKLQDALDAAVLAGARHLPSGEASALASAESYFAPNVLVGAAKAEFSVVEGMLVGTATLAMPTSFMRIVNRDSVELSVRSAAASNGGGMEVVLVLDVSGSMRSRQKIDALKSASLELVDALFGDNETLASTHVALAPFSGRVNVGLYEDGWIDGEASDASPGGGGGKGNNGRGKGADRGGGKGGGGKGGGGGKDDEDGEAVAGCTGRRSAANQQGDAPPEREMFPPFTGDAKACPTPPALALTNSAASLRAAIQALETGHGTSTHEGMAWGFRMISPEWQGLWGNPALPMSYEDTPGKVAVIMTDGSNHPDQAGDGHLSVEDTNDMLLESCSLMKANGITIYTVAFDMKGALTELYQQCASERDFHYDAESNQELIAAFRAIGSRVNGGRLRLLY